MPEPPPQSYAKHLLPLGYGYPLWTPEPSHELLLRRQDGLLIGDVGVVDLENGSFDVFFNICLPREHPFHRVTGVPENFVPVELEEWDIASFPHAEYPGRVISTTSVTATTIESSGETPSRPSTYEFSLASSESALLILPKGAESYKLRKRQMFKDVAIRNAVDWYEFAEHRLGRIITHDSLYLITGLYKASSWSVAAFHQATGTMGSSAQFKAAHVGEGNNITYTWETMRALDWRVGPQIDVGVPNQSVFISGFKIAIREGILGKRKIEVEVDAPPTQLRRSVRFSHDGSSPSKGGDIWRRLRSRGGSASSSGKPVEQTLSAEDPNTITSSALQSDGPDATGNVTINDIPQTPWSLHPSDIVNRYLLSKEPSANVAITHDSEWGILFAKGLLKPEDLLRDERIERIVSANYRPALQDGAGYLQNTCDTSVRQMDIHSAVREAWKEDRLSDAEEMLSRQFTHRTWSDHSIFAIRALIRARLHHWEAALRDATTSIDIKPSVAAYVAKGSVLFGMGKYELAVEAFNVAIRRCDIRDRDIVLLIKFIVLYDVGYHAESMAGIADLVDRCPVEVRPACSCVQAEMCTRLAMLAAKKEEYDRALQLLSRAQSLMPLRVVSDLNTVSLICGWRFDNLQFIIRRQNCEVLYLAGRTSEALTALGSISRHFGEEEEAGTGKENTEWINTFTQKCLDSLETLGDNFMASRNYTEAIVHYTMALDVGPATRDIILIKRSKAYTAAHEWEGALKDADEVISSSPHSPLGYERKHEALWGMGRHDEATRALNHVFTITNRSVDLQTQHYNSTTATQDLSPSYLEQQREAQLGELITQIAALRVQLNSGGATAGRNQMSRNQDDHSEAVGEVTSQRVPVTIVQSDQEHNEESHEAPTTLTRLQDIQAQGSCSIPAPSELLRPRHPLEVSISPLVPENLHHGRHGQEPVTIPVGNSSPDTYSQYLRGPGQLTHNRRSPLNSPGERSAWPITDSGRSEDTQGYVRHGSPSSKRLRERQEQTSSDDSGDDTPRAQHHRPNNLSPGIEGNNISTQPHSLQETEPVGWDASRTMRNPARAHPDIITTAGSNNSDTQSSDTQFELERPTYGPVPMTADMRPHRRRRSSTYFSRGSENHGSFVRNPGWYWTPQQAIAPPPAARDVHIQQPSAWAPPPMYAAIQPGQASLPDVLLEVLREQRFAHRASMDQQQELTRQMRSLNEWLMRELQGRSDESRSTRRPFTDPYIPRMDEGTGYRIPAPAPYSFNNTEFSAYGANIAGVGLFMHGANPFLGPAHSRFVVSGPWYGSTASSSHTLVDPHPLSPVQPSPTASPTSSVRDDDEVTDTKPGTSTGNDEHVPSVKSSIPPKASSLGTTAIPLKSILRGKQASPLYDIRFALSERDIFLIEESAPTKSHEFLGPKYKIPGFPASPYLMMPTHLDVPAYDSAKKLTMTSKAVDEGDPNVDKLDKLGEEQRPGVTFGQATTYNYST